jgi:hypothetical protein
MAVPDVDISPQGKTGWVYPAVDFMPVAQVCDLGLLHSNRYPRSRSGLRYQAIDATAAIEPRWFGIQDCMSRNTG